MMWAVTSADSGDTGAGRAVQVNIRQYQSEL